MAVMPHETEIQEHRVIEASSSRTTVVGIFSLSGLVFFIIVLNTFQDRRKRRSKEVAKKHEEETEKSGKRKLNEKAVRRVMS